jgi:molybdopterin molybdotransferase
MISVAEAWATIAAHLTPLGIERIAVATAAGRTLAEPVAAERDQPPFDRVTMDGAALRLQPGQRRYAIAGTQYAGEPPLTLRDPHTAIEIMTGSALPPGADTVVPVERYTRENDTIVLEDGYAPEAGQFIHNRGSDHARGAALLAPGVRIWGAEAAVIASAGLETVEVARLPRVAIVATGNELVPAGAPVADHEVRLSNAPGLAVMLAAAGFPGASEHHLPDAPDTLRDRLAALLRDNDVIVLSGGVSRGKADYVPGVLEAIGVTRHFHRVAQRPGKPLWFGTGSQGQVVFALPGNPVSTLTCCRRYVLPALALASGQTPEPAHVVALARDWHFAPALTAFVPVRLTDGDEGLVAEPVATNTSGDFAALAGTDGVIALPADRDRFTAGERFAFYGWTSRSA